jgi:hypothetical protein
VVPARSSCHGLSLPGSIMLRSRGKSTYARCSVSWDRLCRQKAPNLHEKVKQTNCSAAYTGADFRLGSARLVSEKKHAQPAFSPDH